MKKRKNLNAVPEYVERTILRPAAENIAEDMKIEYEYVDYKVRNVEIDENGLCFVDIVFYNDSYEEIDYKTVIDYGPLE